MTLFQIFFWYLKINDVSCEVRNLYTNNPKLDYTDYYKYSYNISFVKKRQFKDYFDGSLSTYSWGSDIFPYILEDFIGYDYRNRCSEKLARAIKRWKYFIKNNIKLDLNEDDVVTLRHKIKGESFGRFKGIVKNNIVKVALTNRMGDVEIPIDMIAFVNGSNPNFYIKRNKKVYNGSKGN